jgi:hypothetical protein
VACKNAAAEAEQDAEAAESEEERIDLEVGVAAVQGRNHAHDEFHERQAALVQHYAVVHQRLEVKWLHTKKAFLDSAKWAARALRRAAGVEAGASSSDNAAEPPLQLRPLPSCTALARCRACS